MLVCVRDSKRELFQDGVELRGSRRIHRLISVVFHAMVALFVPIVKKSFFGCARQPAKFEGQRWHALFDKTVLIAANEAYVVRLLVGLHRYASVFRNRCDVIAKRGLAESLHFQKFQRE